MSLQIDAWSQHPFSMLVASGRGGGKTTFTKHLKEWDWLTHPTPQRILWCYAKHQLNLLKELIGVVQAVEYVQVIPPEIGSLFDRNVNNLIILDDMMDEATQDKRVSQLFTRGQHINLPFIYLTQNLFHKNLREISLNSDYVVIFQNPRGKTHFTNLAKQFMPRKYKFLLWGFEDATKLPRSYLLLDMRPETDNKLRVRARIFKDVSYPNIST